MPSNTIPTPDIALKALSDRRLNILVAQFSVMAETYRDGGEPEVAGVYASLMVMAGEESDRRAQLLEHAERELDDHGIGEIVAEGEDPFTAE